MLASKKDDDEVGNDYKVKATNRMSIVD